MKKKLIVLLGVFALVSCSDEVLQDMVQNEEQEFDVNVKTIQPGFYESPYTGDITDSYHINFEFHIYAPIDVIKITPYVGLIYARDHQALLQNPHGGCLLPWTVPCVICNVSPTPPTHYLNYLADPSEVGVVGTLSPLVINHGSTIVNHCNASIPIFNSALTNCPNVPFIFDFGVPLNPTLANPNGPLLGSGESTLISENSKIYFIEYEFDLFGQTFKGLLRHQLGDDSLRLGAYDAYGWTEYTHFNFLNKIGYNNYDEVRVLVNSETEELALAQHDNAITPLNSELVVVDPSSGTEYILRFRNEADRIVIEFI